ncbi:MAG: hydrogenase nickel incorporation protein HypB [Chloroflexi bacterium]|nr:hydrogenase nickel incorporation protein HypB [Chloroflexota bacterium]MBM3154093.1 hydrogenase nickel incorporation protein HypB [Chloroflexota bacterium]MBM3175768.1 hydrogenase nickel incorporation protein HypB [Chloroflexota bacterium]MBM4450924.1 hydrogenase nickel incorporation protein HypB [Chloroflexota bacterium]
MKRKIQVLKDITSANDAIAAQSQQLLDKHHILALNVMSSPGAGKTSLILNTIARLRDKLSIAVIEGDIASKVDADKIDKEGIPVVQINTGGGCSLEAAMVNSALHQLPLEKTDVLFIENVGNLVCPATFALGEHKKLVIASIPEGDDKPTKYPIMFAEADVVVINKLDLLPYVDFDLAHFRKVVKGLNPDVQIFEVSCKTGKGLDAWCSWLANEVGSR